jgi:long-chain acyl-CoA synthetase
LRQSLRHVSQILNEGYNALIFPEGGRQVSGEMAEFKPVIGYLALTNKVGILPVYLKGTFEAFPKGVTIPKAKSIGAKVSARVGRYLEYDELFEMTKDLAKTDAYRMIAARVEHEVRNMKDGKRDKFDAEALRLQWKKERKKPIKKKAVADE